MKNDKMQNEKYFKLFKNKKGVNDVSILTGIVLLFVSIGVILPFIQTDFNITSSTNISTTKLEANVGEDLRSESTISIFTVLFSVSKMFFWTFGDLPFWLDMIFVVIRIIFGVIIARNIWIGGGA